MITVKLPPGAGSVEFIVYEGEPTHCPRCRKPTPIVLAFVRSADKGRATLHCGCMTGVERNGAEAPQTFDSEAVRVAAEKQVRETLKTIT